MFFGAAVISTAQRIPPNSWPHNYTGIPSGAYSPQWQRCTCCFVLCFLDFDYRIPQDFEVKDALPNVTVPLPRSFAGSISTNRAGHANDSLFFWGFEREKGSLTAAAHERVEEPWIIWLNGGPGSSRRVIQSIN